MNDFFVYLIVAVVAAFVSIITCLVFRVIDTGRKHPGGIARPSYRSDKGRDCKPDGEPYGRR